jgi:transposase
MSVRRPNYAQRWLLPPSVDEWVPVDHPVRFVSDFVDAVDLAEHGIAEAAGEVGRPPVAAEVLLKIWLYGFTQRIRSTRKLEKACVETMPFLWLTGNDPPDHNTIWRFFKNNRDALKKLFKTLMQAAADAELIDFALHALDGTKLQAASSTDTALHRKSIEKKLKLLTEIIAQYMAEVDAAAEQGDRGLHMPKPMQDVDARRQKILETLARRVEDREDGLRMDARTAEAGKPPGGPPQASADAPARSGGEGTEAGPAQRQADRPAEAAPSGDTAGSDAEEPKASTAGGDGSRAEPGDVDPMLREAQALQKEYEARLAKLDATGENHLSERETDARMMKGRGMSALGYNAQIIVDHESDLIVACEVSAQCNDLKQLTPMLQQVRDLYRRVADETVADGGYDSGAQLARAEAQNMPAIVRQREESETNGEFSKSSFRYDAANNVYICLRGEKLTQIGTNRSRASAEEPDAIYRCHNKACPVRRQCSRDPRGRKIRRPPGEDARERQAQKQQDPRVKLLLGLRKEVVEHLFGIIKTVDGFRRFTVRGLEKAAAQWTLVCLALNLRRLGAVASWVNGRLVPRRLPQPPAGAATA